MMTAGSMPRLTPDTGIRNFDSAIVPLVCIVLTPAALGFAERHHGLVVEQIPLFGAKVTDGNGILELANTVLR